MRPSALWSETTLPPPMPHSPGPPSPPVGCDGVQQVLWGLGLHLAQPCPFQRAHAPDCHRSPPPPPPTLKPKPKGFRVVQWSWQTMCGVKAEQGRNTARILHRSVGDPLRRLTSTSTVP